MPNTDGSLSDDELAKIVKTLQGFWAINGGKKPCTKCGDERFFIHPALLGNRSDTVNVNDAHTRQPTVMIYCQQCGFADHYVARLLGVTVLMPQVGNDG